MTQIEVDGEWMEQCDNCGNIWDGYAQCNCWQYNWHDEVADAGEAAGAGEAADAADESGYETD